MSNVTLEQYAGVTTALSEGFALAEILAQEQIEADAWAKAERAWPKAIVDSVDLYFELIEKRRIAEDCLGRKLAPLDDDPAAWMGLMNALATSEDRSAVASGLGLSAADVSRLDRRWKKKMRSDAELQKRVQDLSGKATLPSHVEAGPQELRPFPWTPKRVVSEKGTALDEAGPLSFDEFVTKTPQVQLASFQLLRPQSGQQTSPPTMSEEETRVDASAVPSTKPATPFETIEPEAHGVSLFKYVELLAELQQPGADKASILALRNLDAARFKSVEAHYRAKCDQETKWAAEVTTMFAKANQAIAARKVSMQGPPTSSGTEELPATAYLQEALLPFNTSRKTPPAPSAQISPLASTAEDVDVGSYIEDAECSTREISAADYLQPEPLPFAPPVPELGPEQYAWIVATFRRTPPEKMRETLERFRLTNETRRLLDEKWQARMMADPALAEVVKAAVRRHMSSSP